MKKKDKEILDKILEEWQLETNQGEDENRAKAVRRINNAILNDADELDLSNLSLTSLPEIFSLDFITIFREINLSNNNLTQLGSFNVNPKTKINLTKNPELNENNPSVINLLSSGFGNISFDKLPSTLQTSDQSTGFHLAVFDASPKDPSDNHQEEFSFFDIFLGYANYSDQELSDKNGDDSLISLIENSKKTFLTTDCKLSAIDIDTKKFFLQFSQLFLKEDANYHHPFIQSIRKDLSREIISAILIIDKYKDNPEFLDKIKSFFLKIHLSPHNKKILSEAKSSKISKTEFSDMIHNLVIFCSVIKNFENSSISQGIDQDHLDHKKIVSTILTGHLLSLSKSTIDEDSSMARDSQFSQVLEAFFLSYYQFKNKLPSIDFSIDDILSDETLSKQAFDIEIDQNLSETIFGENYASDKSFFSRLLATQLTKLSFSNFSISEFSKLSFVKETRKTITALITNKIQNTRQDSGGNLPESLREACINLNEELVIYGLSIILEKSLEENSRIMLLDDSQIDLVKSKMDSGFKKIFLSSAKIFDVSADEETGYQLMAQRAKSFNLASGKRGAPNTNELERSLLPEYDGSSETPPSTGLFTGALSRALGKLSLSGSRKQSREPAT